MPDEDLLPPPLEIPWKLAATTQPLTAGDPDETAISLFSFEPDDEDLTSQFPDERLVYVKVTVTISPATPPPGIPPVAGTALGEGVPCFHMLLDLRVRNDAGDVGTIRPYFHAAAPLNRRMIQTGVVGSELYEGESDGQFMGKSGSQMYETSSSTSRTTSLSASAGVGIGPFSVGGSARRTSTDVSGERAVSQTSDITTREASEERRELVSHHSRIENVLTLLNAKYVGTPHLTFSLSPRPLHLLSLDPSDPNLWFSQLLQRRSSGIEGTQEFTAVVLVPRGENFCLSARLRRVCVLDDPPGPFEIDEPFSLNAHLVRLLNYLERVFPPGTPLDEFDVDLVGLLAQPDDFIRPALEVWSVAGTMMIAGVVSPARNAPAGVTKRGDVPYKQHIELWLETLRDDYEREVARSPLERGVLLGEDRTLDACFALAAAAGGAVVTSSSTSVSPAFRVDVDPGELDLGGIMATASSARSTVRERAFETVTRWNLLEDRLGVLLRNRRKARQKPFRLDDVRVVGVLIELWSKLSISDPRNLDFEAASDALRLDEKQRRLVKAAGATDLRSIAAAIKSAPDIARYNERVSQHRTIRKKERVAGAQLQAIRTPISREAAADLLRSIGAGLQAAMPGEPAG